MKINNRKKNLFSKVFHIRLSWIEAVQMIFASIGAIMAALGFTILCFGCLATGATRHKVYRAWRSRVGGRISCAVVSNDRKIKSQFSGHGVTPSVMHLDWIRRQ